MTNAATPIDTPTAARSGRPGLAVLPERRSCRHHDLKLLVRLHNRMQRILIAYTTVSEAIVRQIGAA